MNGALSENVYWKVEGAVSINNYSVFRGTIICNNGALGALNTGVILDGRALTTNGALTSTAMDATATLIPGNCSTIGLATSKIAGDLVDIYPNPFQATTTIRFNNPALLADCEFKIYNSIGAEVLSIKLRDASTTIDNHLRAGVYFYRVIAQGQTLQSGQVIAKN